MAKSKVVLIPFPFDDLSATKVRPAVCLTEPVGPHKHIVLAFITSRVLSNALDTDYVLDVGLPDFPGTGLLVSSTVRLHRLMTVTQSLALRELGALSSDMQAQVDVRLHRLFDLA